MANLLLRDGFLISTVGLSRALLVIRVLSSFREQRPLPKKAVRPLVWPAVVVGVAAATCPPRAHADAAKDGESDRGAVASAQETEARTMKVRVVDDEGQPLPGASVYASIWKIEGQQGFPNRNYTADDDGKVAVAMPLRMRILRLWASKEKHVPQFLNFAKGVHKEGRLIPDSYEFRLPKGRRLSGRVVDVDGNPIVGATVGVKVEVDEPAWTADSLPIVSTWLANGDDAVTTDEQGRWEIDNAPGPPDEGAKDHEFRLQVTHPDFAGDAQWGELQRQQGITTDDLRNGTAELTLESGIALTGVVSGPDGELVTEGLVIWSDHPYWATGVNETPLDALGRYKTKHLSPGTYPITVLAPGYAPWQKRIEVSQGLGEL
ncbi:MAG: hypothetical protein AAF961_07885, partial [Planctomycetota bacterium]